MPKVHAVVPQPTSAAEPTSFLSTVHRMGITGDVVYYGKAADNPKDYQDRELLVAIKTTTITHFFVLSTADKKQLVREAWSTFLSGSDVNVDVSTGGVGWQNKRIQSGDFFIKYWMVRAGKLYLTIEINQMEFQIEDEAVLRLFASQYTAADLR